MKHAIICALISHQVKKEDLIRALEARDYHVVRCERKAALSKTKLLARIQYKCRKDLVLERENIFLHGVKVSFLSRDEELQFQALSKFILEKQEKEVQLSWEDELPPPPPPLLDFNPNKNDLPFNIDPQKLSSKPPSIPENSDEFVFLRNQGSYRGDGNFEWEEKECNIGHLNKELSRHQPASSPCMLRNQNVQLEEEMRKKYNLRAKFIEKTCSLNFQWEVDFWNIHPEPVVAEPLSKSKNLLQRHIDVLAKVLKPSCEKMDRSIMLLKGIFLEEQNQLLRGRNKKLLESNGMLTNEFSSLKEKNRSLEQEIFRLRMYEMMMTGALFEDHLSHYN